LYAAMPHAYAVTFISDPPGELRGLALLRRGARAVRVPRSSSGSAHRITAAEPELIAALCDRHEGVLPKARVFEFKLADSSQVIRGKISPTVGDAEALNRELHRPTVIKVMVTRVGSGRPRYLLLEAPAAAPTT